jgi:hypothetical protein
MLVHWAVGRAVAEIIIIEKFYQVTTLSIVNF